MSDWLLRSPYLPDCVLTVKSVSDTYAKQYATAYVNRQFLNTKVLLGVQGDDWKWELTCLVKEVQLFWV